MEGRALECATGFRLVAAEAAQQAHALGGRRVAPAREIAQTRARLAPHAASRREAIGRGAPDPLIIRSNRVGLRPNGSRTWIGASAAGAAWIAGRWMSRISS